MKITTFNGSLSTVIEVNDPQLDWVISHSLKTENVVFQLFDEQGYYFSPDNFRVLVEL